MKYSKLKKTGIMLAANLKHLIIAHSCGNAIAYKTSYSTHHDDEDIHQEPKTLVSRLNNNLFNKYIMVV